MSDSITYKGYTIDIEQDDHPLDPRKEDNLGVMVCFHKRYVLGDKTELKSDMFGGWSELREYLARKLKAKIILPIYMLDHSGITISTKSFNDPWDSGQIGFIYTTAKRMNKFFGKPRTQQARIARDAKALDTLLTEVNTYDAYLRGDVWGYIIHDTNGIIIDSCWGYYDTNDALAEAKNRISHYSAPTKEASVNTGNVEHFTFERLPISAYGVTTTIGELIKIFEDMIDLCREDDIIDLFSGILESVLQSGTASYDKKSGKFILS